MKKIPLGRTKLSVTPAGLGCGGHSRLGRGYGASHEDAANVVRAALDMGINFIDTAQVYGTEEIVGDALSGQREKAILSTKGGITAPGGSPLGSAFISANELAEKLDASLKNLKTDYVDIYHLHGIMPHQYDICVERFLPLLRDMQQAGKIRYIGLTERFIHDPAHDMLRRALQDDYWDVVMVGFNMINPSARKTILPLTGKQNVGVLNMFAVRNTLGSIAAAQALLLRLAADGKISVEDANDQTLFAQLLAATDSGSLTEAAYRFCRHEPGNHVILSGTGNIDHLNDNMKALSKPPLADELLGRLEALFGHIDSVSGE